MTRKIAVVGNGGFGTAMALVLLENGHDVTIWGHDDVYAQQVERTRENPKFLPGISLPPELKIVSDQAEATDGVDLVVNAVPTAYLRDVMLSFKEHLPPRVPIVSLTKGIEQETLKRPSQIIREAVPGHSVAVLSGPSHAEEVALRIPASVVVSASSDDLSKRLQKIFNTTRFRVYTNSDPVGVELGGALKNVIALAAGVSDGLGFGDNTKAALVTRGLVEIVRLASAMGARKMTFTGLAGMGDLITTAFSRHGRNRAVGQRLGEGIPLERILRETEKVAEGVYTTKAVMKLARKHKVDMPLSKEVHAILFSDKDPAAALTDLMARSRKNEEW